MRLGVLPGCRRPGEQINELSGKPRAVRRYQRRMLFAGKITGNDMVATVMAGEDEIGTVPLEVAGEQQFRIGNADLIEMRSVEVKYGCTSPVTAFCGRVSHCTLPARPKAHTNSQPHGRLARGRSPCRRAVEPCDKSPFAARTSSMKGQCVPGNLMAASGRKPAALACVVVARCSCAIHEYDCHIGWPDAAHPKTNAKPSQLSAVWGERERPMSDTANAESQPVQQTVPQPYQPIRALLRAGKNDEAIVLLCALTVTRPNDALAKELLFDAFFQKRDWLPAFALIDELARVQPDNARLQKSLTTTLSNMKRYDEAIVQAARYIDRHGEDLTILDVLKVAHFYTGKIDDAVRFGQRGIELRDAEACRLPRTVDPDRARRPADGRNVIAFSLWGSAPFYAYGAMINLLLSRTIYPGWSCRFYVGADVPRACVAFLADNGADVRKIEDEYPGVGLFQRFLVMNDPAVGRFLVRDCDARLSAPKPTWSGNGSTAAIRSTWCATMCCIAS